MRPGLQLNNPLVYRHVGNAMSAEVAAHCAFLPVHLWALLDSDIEKGLTWTKVSWQSVMLHSGSVIAAPPLGKSGNCRPDRILCLAQGMFSKRIVFFTVGYDDHWSLLAVRQPDCELGPEAPWDPDMIHFDSMAFPGVPVLSPLPFGRDCCSSSAPALRHRVHQHRNLSKLLPTVNTGIERACART